MSTKESNNYLPATNLCFGEKKIYTQEVLALVMQNLMEQTPLPTLFMRTVLQSLSMYPRLLGLVLNILQRLILKQVSCCYIEHTLVLYSSTKLIHINFERSLLVDMNTDINI